MKKKSLIMIAIGLVLLLVGGVMQFTGGPTKADAALVAHCRQNVTERGGDADLIAQCDEQAFASAMTATDAESAARAISGANTSEVGGNTLSMFLLGLGLALVVGGVVVRRGVGRVVA